MTARDWSACGAPPLPPGFLARPVAHRGLHGAERAENGLPAIRAAVARGYGIEIDLRPSADGVAMVFHDDRLERMTGVQGRVAERAAGALGALRLGGTGAAIPTLAQALEAVAGAVPLLIELKDGSGPLERSDGVLEAAVARALAGYAGPVAVMSFNPEMVAEMAARAPAVPRGLTTAAFGPDWNLASARRARLRGIVDFEAVGAGFVSHEAADLARPRVAELKAAGAAILCWTIRSPAEARAALARADQITFEGFCPS